jgi:hypothetical protein
MTGTSILYMLFGAALVTVGVFATALADRLRGLRVRRESTAPRNALRDPVVVKMEHAPHASGAGAGNLGKQEAKKQDAKTKTMADDVIAALVAAGYKKAAASDATWSCRASERATVEGWATAALRAAAKGGVS